MAYTEHTQFLNSFPNCFQRESEVLFELLKVLRNFHQKNSQQEIVFKNIQIFICSSSIRSSKWTIDLFFPDKFQLIFLGVM